MDCHSDTSALPLELCSEVLKYLPANELWTAAHASRQFYAAAWRAGLFIHRDIDCQSQSGYADELTVFKEVFEQAQRKDVLCVSQSLTCFFPGQDNPRRCKEVLLLPSPAPTRYFPSSRPRFRALFTCLSGYPFPPPARCAPSACAASADTRILLRWSSLFLYRSDSSRYLRRLELALPFDALRDLHIDMHRHTSPAYNDSLDLSSFPKGTQYPLLERLRLLALKALDSRRIAFLAHELGSRPSLELVGVEFAEPVASALLEQTASTVRGYPFVGRGSREDRDGGLWDVELFNRTL